MGSTRRRSRALTGVLLVEAFLVFIGGGVLNLFTEALPKEWAWLGGVQFLGLLLVGVVVITLSIAWVRIQLMSAHDAHQGVASAGPPPIESPGEASDRIQLRARICAGVAVLYGQAVQRPPPYSPSSPVSSIGQRAPPAVNDAHLVRTRHARKGWWRRRGPGRGRQTARIAVVIVRRETSGGCSKR